jgi:flavodoxin
MNTKEIDMKTLIIYTSQTGFTKRYAQWLADRVSGDLILLP